MSNPTTTVRPGEELPLDALSDYLRNQWPGFSKINTLRQFPGGYSNLTYLLETDAGAVVLRRPPVGAQIKSAHDMGREFRVLSLLRGHFDKIPQPVLFCEDETIIGAPFYLMEQVQGVVLRSKPPKEFQLTPDLMRRISEAAVDTLAALHGIDVEATGLIQLGKPQGYIERQTTGWTERYRKSETDTVTDMDAVAAWLNAHRPEDGAPAFLHNDFKYDNVLLDPHAPTRILAVLDWEMATVGDPDYDLGTSLAYWAEADDPGNLRRFGTTHLPGNLDRNGLIGAYEHASGRRIDDPVFLFAYGLFKLAGIMQQIYARYRRGSTEDPRFAGLIALVHDCATLADRAIRLDRISGLADPS